MKPPITNEQAEKRANELRQEVAAEETTSAPIETYADHRFSFLSIDTLGEILSLTIKQDDVPKKLMFLACVANYIGDNQLNIAMNGPSSSGKTYISNELLKLFPREDVFTIGKISPQAFYHSHGKMNEEDEEATMVVDLERKIYFFSDQPNTALLENLRPMLSKDSKEVVAMITDRNKRGSNRTKKVVLRGFPTIIFCSANLNMDDQERTRLLLLSPELSQTKIDAAIEATLSRVSNAKAGFDLLESDQRRQDLKKRIIAIKYSRITDVVINHADILEAYKKRYSRPLSKHSRDIERISYLIKGYAALNFQHREKHGEILFSKKEDVETVFSLWDKISTSQDAGIQPYVVEFFEEYIRGAYKAKYQQLEDVERIFETVDTAEEVRGVTFKEIAKFHYKQHRQTLNIKYLRQHILESLEQADWISIVKNPVGGREFLVVIEKPIDEDNE